MPGIGGRLALVGQLESLRRNLDTTGSATLRFPLTWYSMEGFFQLGGGSAGVFAQVRVRAHQARSRRKLLPSSN